MSLTNGFALAQAITPSDTADLPYDALYVASIAGGAVAVLTPALPNGASDVTITGLTVGLVIPIKAKRVKTGTTATLLGLGRG